MVRKRPCAHLFYEDFDGDGDKDVMTEFEGTWNRVLVYSPKGQPRYTVEFGPGKREQLTYIRDLDVADLDGDGIKEILVATAGQMIVALNGKCQRVWATRLPGPPTVLEAFSARKGKDAWILVGCEDGTVALLDATGALIRTARIKGRPGCAMAFETNNGMIAVLATDQGVIKGFRHAE